MRMWEGGAPAPPQRRSVARVLWVEAHQEVRPPERMWEGEAPAEPESPPALRSAAVAPSSPWRYREYIDFSELWFFY